MSTRNKFLSQQATLSNANQTVVEPINWSLILAKTAPKWTPRTVRAYLTCVCEQLNAHFAYIISGKDIGKIEVTRKNRIPELPPVKIRPKQLVVDSLWFFEHTVRVKVCSTLGVAPGRSDHENCPNPDGTGRKVQIAGRARADCI